MAWCQCVQFLRDLRTTSLVMEAGRLRSRRQTARETAAVKGAISVYRGQKQFRTIKLMALMEG